MLRRVAHQLQNHFFVRLEKTVSSTQPGKMMTVIRLASLWVLYKFRTRRWVMSALWSKPTWGSLVASILGLRYNLNHLGNVYSLPSDQLSTSQQLERQVVERLKALLDAQDESIEGYLTAGGTESNLYLLWTAREWWKARSQRRGKRQENNPAASMTRLVVMMTDFTHYSVRKAVRILDLDQARVAVAETDWGMSPAALQAVLQAEYHLGRRGFAIGLTVGYSSTGAADQLTPLLQVVTEFQENNPDAACFVWVDAAMQGLPFMLLNSAFRPFRSPLVQGLVIDFHKLGQTPLPTGIVLYRAELRSYIETEIDYLFETDATVSGSRPGFAALAIWANLFQWRPTELVARFQALEKQKQTFITQFAANYPDAKVIATPGSLTIGIVINQHFPRLTPSQEAQSDLQLADISYLAWEKGRPVKRRLQHYKLHFLDLQQPYFELLRRAISSGR